MNTIKFTRQLLERENRMGNKRMSVLITTNIPSPYMIDYLTELSKYCEITAVFEMCAASDRDPQWYGKEFNSFKAIFLNAIRIGNEQGFSFKVLRYLKKGIYDRIIIANPTTPTGILELLYCRWFSIPFCIQSEGGFQGSGKGIKEKFKKYIMEKAEMYLTGMGGENDYFLMYGASKQQLRPYPFTSLHDEEIKQAALKTKFAKKVYREKLNISEEKIILSVGRFSYNAGYGKGYDYLMRLAERMPNDIGFYIVGDLPTEEFVNWKRNSQLSNVHFIGFKNKQELAEYYAAADLFILLTRGDTWGLVINEAMMFSLPIISSDKCIAGLELVKNGENGFVVSLDDEDEIKNRIDYILENPEIATRFGESSYSKIQKYSIENMSLQIFQSISNVML